MSISTEIPDSSQAINASTQCIKDGDIERGLQMLEEVVKAFPRESEGFRELASVLVSLGEFQKAILALKQATLLCPKDMNLYKQLGYAHYHVKEYSAAAASYRTSISLSPKDLDSRRSLAEIYRMQERFPESLEQINEGLVLAPEDVGLWEGKAVICEHLDEKALAMSALKRAKALRNKQAARPRLGSVNVEVTTFCNFSCAGCLRTVMVEQGTWRNRHLSVEEFQKVVEGMPHTEGLLVWGVGEPSLHPNLPDIIKMASLSKKFSRIVLTSDISARDIHYYIKLFNFGLSHLVVSVDTLDQGLANQIRKGTKVDNLESRLRTLLQSCPGRVDIRTVVSRKNIMDLSNLFDRLDRLGVLRVNLQPYADLGNPDGCLTWEELAWVSSQVPKLAPRFTNLTLVMGEFLPSPAICTRPWRDPYVTADGHLTPCCRLTDSREFSFGNILESSFKEVYDSPEARNWRENFLEESPAICDSCQMHISRKAPTSMPQRKDIPMLQGGS
ncbi:SPASM domain-containing protein [Candidatus Nitrospira salsa]|nr:MAG: hypothetical protein NPIRA01_06660 [Nitrospirales bacterium]